MGWDFMAKAGPEKGQFTRPPVIMVQWQRGLPFKYPAIFHWTMMMIERVDN